MTVTLDELAAVNRPEQFGIMAEAVDLLSASPAVSSLMVRGSFAAGNSDRLSDIDLVAGVREGDFADFAASQDALVSGAFTQVLPGWPDTIVPPEFGGLGWVHLLQSGPAMYQLDLYLAPSGRMEDIRSRSRGRVVYLDGEAGAAGPRDAATAAAFVQAEREAEPSAVNLVTELLVLAHMVHKRVARGQRYMAYKEAFQFTDAARGLARTALAPHSAYLRWYHLEETLSVTPLGRSCLALLDELTALPAVPDAGSLSEMLSVGLRLAELAAPEAYDTLKPGLSAYLSLT